MSIPVAIMTPYRCARRTAPATLTLRSLTSPQLLSARGWRRGGIWTASLQESENCFIYDDCFEKSIIFAATNIKLMTMRERKVKFESGVAEKRFVALQHFYHQPLEKEPCVYTVEEMEFVAMLAERDIKEGRGISQEEMRKKYVM